MHLEHFASTHLSIGEAADPETFFSGSGREEVFRSLMLDILAEQPLLKLVGAEGSGKTMICRLIEKRLPDVYQVVTLDDPSGSFEDVLRMVYLALGLDQRGASTEVEPLPELQQLLELLYEKGKRVVLIIDGAEKLFLASLERLVRHVREASGNLKLTLVLVGRPGLDDNLKQIASLSSGASFSNAYSLSDLSESETRQYLRFRVEAAGMSREHFAEVFTEPILYKIFTEAKGNLRLINILAEEALQNFCAEKSFMALLDRVEPGAGGEPEPRPSRMLLLLDLLRSNPILTGALLGSVVLILGVGIFLHFMDANPSRKEPVRSQISSQVASTPQSFPGQGRPDSQTILQERLKASGDWLAGIYQGKYTIQLMMLSSPMAQSRLADTLGTDEYAPLLDQVYILQKQTTPPTLLVYYGVYESLDAAREARNSMPVFLRQHQPYPLSISEAMAKIDNR